MGRRSTVGHVVLALALSTVAVTGCGSDGSAPTTGPAVRPRAKVTAEAWTDRFCTAYTTWSDALDDAGTTAAAAFALPDPTANKAALVVLFESSATATRRLVRSLARGPIPDVAGGAGFVTDLTARFEDYETTLEASRADAAGMATDDEAGFLAQVEELRTDYQANRGGAQTALASLGESGAGAELAAAGAADCTS